MKLHLAHMTEASKTNWMQGYSDAIASVRWALQDLGHDVTYGVNQLRPDRRTILFGGHLIPEQFHARLRSDTIFYNLNRISGPNHESLRLQLSALAAKFQFWDCDESGAAAVQGSRLVPLGFAPVLRRIAMQDEQDIDAVVIGVPTTARLKLFQSLVIYKSRCVFVHGLFGALRDELIGRAKVVLAIVDDRSNAAPAVRFNLLLANSKAVVSTFTDSNRIAEALRSAVIEVDPPALVGTVQHLVAMESERRALEGRAFSLFRQQDARPALEAALGA